MKKEILIILSVFLLVLPMAMAFSMLPDSQVIGRFYLNNSPYIDFILITLPMFAIANFATKSYGRSGTIIALTFSAICGFAWSYYSMTTHKSLIGAYLMPILIIIIVNVILMVVEFSRARHHNKFALFILGLAWLLTWPIIKSFLSNYHKSYVSTFLTIGDLSMLFIGLAFLYYIGIHLSKTHSPHLSNFKREKNPWNDRAFNHTNRDAKTAERKEEEELRDIEKNLSNDSRMDIDEENKTLREIEENLKEEQDVKVLKRYIDELNKLSHNFDEELRLLKEEREKIHQLEVSKSLKPENIRYLENLKQNYNARVNEINQIKSRINSLFKEIKNKLTGIVENLINQINIEKQEENEEKREDSIIKRNLEEAEKGYNETQKRIIEIRKEMKRVDRWHENTEGEKQEKQKKLRQLTADYRKLMKGEIDFKKLITDLTYDIGIDKNEKEIQKHIGYVLNEEIELTKREIREINSLLQAPPGAQLPGIKKIGEIYQKIVKARREVNNYLQQLKRNEAIEKKRFQHDSRL